MKRLIFPADVFILLGALAHALNQLTKRGTLDGIERRHGIDNEPCFEVLANLEQLDDAAAVDQDAVSQVIQDWIETECPDEKALAGARFQDPE